MRLGAIPLICLFLFACMARGEQVKESDITRIVYRFQDSSVPPEFHRSYTITVNPKSLEFVVDSYGKIIKDTTVSINDAKWSNAKKAFGAHNIRLKNETDSKGCTGGKTRSLTLDSGDKEIFKGHSYDCGGKTYGNMSGDLDAFLNDLKSGIDPNVFAYK